MSITSLSDGDGSLENYVTRFQPAKNLFYYKNKIQKNVDTTLYTKLIGITSLGLNNNEKMCYSMQWALLGAKNAEERRYYQRNCCPWKVYLSVNSIRLFLFGLCNVVLCSFL